MITFGEKLPGFEYGERHGSYGIIVSENQLIALIKLPQGHYLPGGGINDNEPATHALEREILEELGFNCRVHEYIGSSRQFVNITSKKYPHIKVGHFYHATLIEKVCNPIEMDHQLEWHPLEQARHLLRHEFQRWALECAYPSAQNIELHA